MKYDDKELDRIREFLERGGDPEEAEQGHLSVQELIVLREGELSSKEAKRMEDHLSSCPACSDLLREIEEFSQPPAMGGEGTAGNGGTAAEWREVHSRLDREGWFRPVAPGARREPQPPPPQRAGRSRPVSWRRWAPTLAAVQTAYALAAALFLAVVGLSFYSLSLRRELEQPVSVLKILTLDASGMRSEERIHEIRLPHLLELRVSPGGPAYPEYRVEVTDSDGRRLHDVSIEEEGDLGFTILLPKRFLLPGNYRFELFGVREGQREPLARHVVRVLP